MSKHTPGPWTLKAKHPEGAIGIYPPSGLLVAVARYSSNPKITQGNAEANARLIAAAPELLEVLKDLLPEDCEDDSECLHCKAMYVIAKAEGKS